MLRLGLVDFDSSHCVEFTRRLNQIGVDRDQYVQGAKVVAGATRPSVMSPERIPEHEKLLREFGVEIVPNPSDFLGDVDGVLVLSVSGTSHQESARDALTAGLPVFVDKPFACNMADAEAMIALARQSGSLLWSSSAMRFSEEVLKAKATDSPFGPVREAITFGPAIRAEGNPGWLHYGIHAAEILWTLMESDWDHITSRHEDAVDWVTAITPSGRTGVIRASRGDVKSYGFTAFCERGINHQIVSTQFAYRNLCQAIVNSFESGTSPVSWETTLKFMQFLIAAGEDEKLSKV